MYLLLKSFQRYLNQRAFTLTEVLIVLALIATLSLIGYTNYASFQKHARDTKRKSDIQAITVALKLYAQDHHAYPPNHRANVASCTLGSADGFSDTAFLDELVPQYLNNIPEPPTGKPVDSYCYYDYHKTAPSFEPWDGAVVKTTLEAEPQDLTGVAGSCRPFPVAGFPDPNWCKHDAANSQYCLCMPH